MKFLCAWFEQLLAERPHTRYHKGRAIREYIKANGARNEALDCAVGNLAMAHYLCLHKWPDAEWQRLRAHLRANTPDLFASADVQAAHTAAAAPSPSVSPHDGDHVAAATQAVAAAPALDQPPPPPAPAWPVPAAQRRVRAARGAAVFT